jgi:hypothetical protein
MGTPLFIEPTRQMNGFWPICWIAELHLTDVLVASGPQLNPKSLNEAIKLDDNSEKIRRF